MYVCVGTYTIVLSDSSKHYYFKISVYIQMLDNILCSQVMFVFNYGANMDLYLGC